MKILATRITRNENKNAVKWNVVVENNTDTYFDVNTRILEGKSIPKVIDFRNRYIEDFIFNIADFKISILKCYDDSINQIIYALREYSYPHDYKLVSKKMIEIYAKELKETINIKNAIFYIHKSNKILVLPFKKLSVLQLAEGDTIALGKNDNVVVVLNYNLKHTTLKQIKKDLEEIDPEIDFLRLREYIESLEKIESLE